MTEHILTCQQWKDRVVQLEAIIDALHQKERETKETQRKALDTLREKEERCRRTLDHMLEGCQIIDRSWRYVYVNDAVAKHGRTTKEALLSQTMMEAYPGIDQTDIFICLKQCMNERVPHRIENEFLFPDGSKGWYELSIQPVPEGIFVLSLDITDRKEMEQSLTRREAEYRALFEESRDAFMAIAPPTWKFSTANRACMELFSARNLAEFTLFTPWELSPAFQPDGRSSADKAREMIQIAMQNGSHFFEWTHKRLDERVFPATVLLTRIELGNETMLQATVRDITEQRRAEETARRVQEELIAQQRNEKVRIQAKLAMVQDELVRKARLAAIGQVAANIAHDLRNPLGAARNACYLLKRHGSGDHAHMEEYLSVIDREIKTAHDVIDSLLAMAHEKTLVKESVDFGELVEHVIQTIGEQDRVVCHMTLMPQPFIFQADPIQMRQVVTNLIRNATEAINGQGELIVQASREPDMDVLVFRDSGPGFELEFHDKLFEPLITTKATGTGLGLTICQQIIERHGGTITGSKDPGKGAMITIRLPRSEPDRSSAC